MITTVCPPDHRHGDVATCYTTHKCRCAGCVSSWTRRNEHIRRLKAYGRYVSPLVDPAAAREHIERLNAAGMTAPVIATVAGVDGSTVYGILRGRPGRPCKQIHASVSNAILAVEFSIDRLPDQSLFTGRGVMRRLQALTARGWSLSELGRRMQLSPQRVEQMIRCERTTAGVHRRVAALYEELWNETPPVATPGQKNGYTRAIKRARLHRWLPPLAWDDIDTDEQPPAVDVEANVDEMAVELACSGERVELNHAERRAVVEELHGRRWSDALIATHAGCDARTVLRIRGELGLSTFEQDELVKLTAA